GTVTTVIGSAIPLSGDLAPSRTVGQPGCEAPCEPAAAGSLTGQTLSGAGFTPANSVSIPVIASISAESYQSWGGQSVTFTISGSSVAGSQSVYVGGPGCVSPCGSGVINVSSISAPASQSVTISVPPSSAGSYGIQLGEPTGVAVDTMGNLY